MDNAGVPTGTCIHTYTHTHLMDWNGVSPAYSPCLMVQRQPGHQHEGTPHADTTRSAGQTVISEKMELPCWDLKTAALGHKIVEWESWRSDQFGKLFLDSVFNVYCSGWNHPLLRLIHDLQLNRGFVWRWYKILLFPALALGFESSRHEHLKLRKFGCLMDEGGRDVRIRAPHLSKCLNQSVDLALHLLGLDWQF